MLLSTLAAVSCSTAPEEPAACDVDALLRPECGVLLGATSPVPSSESLADTEASLNRELDFVYRFHRLDEEVPTDDERALADRGRLLHYSLDTSFKDPTAPTYLSWGQIAAGAADTWVSAQAQGIASLPGPVWVTFEHEADVIDRDWQGNGADFTGAWRRVHDIFEREGASNAVWTWVVTGGVETTARAAELWPGNDVVDWVSWEAYDPGGCRINAFDETRALTFEEALEPFYTWYTTEAERYGIDPTKPVMLSEVGSSIRPGNEEWRRRWYADIPGTLKDYPQIEAVGLFDHTGNESCDYRFSRDGTVDASFAAALTPKALRRFPEPTESD